MKSYRIDFAMNRGHEMILDRAEGIHRNELDEIELNMLHGQRIPYLLPIDWFELDGKVTFRYELTGKKMLLHRLQQQTLTMDQYYLLLLGVTDALNECKHYMLRPEGCLLDDQYIFIGEQLHDIRLVYIPLKGNGGEQPTGSGDLLSLIVRWTSYIGQIDGEGLKRVLHHLNASKWPLAELRATLLDLIGGHRSKSENQEEPRQLYQQQAFEAQQQQMMPPTRESHAKPKPFSSSVTVKSTFDDIPYVEEEEQDNQVTKRKWLATAGLAIAIACVWRFIHLAAPTRQSLLISAGITLLLIVGVLLVWRKRISQLSSLEEEQIEMDQHLPDSAPFAKLHNWHTEDELKESTLVKSWNDRNEGSVENPETALHVVAANRPVPLAEPTVLLASEQQKQLPGEQIAWLKRCWEGQETKIELVEHCFKIGRGGEQVSYADSANGVSRIHLEIEYLNGEYGAKDLGSRNGSLLNGQTMIPYKTYKLATGDVIHLAGDKGPAYELKSG
ncbi:MAG: DUF6382 domain-containing protein [Bacillota bacterium]